MFHDVCNVVLVCAAVKAGVLCCVFCRVPSLCVVGVAGCCRVPPLGVVVSVARCCGLLSLFLGAVLYCRNLSLGVVDVVGCCRVPSFGVVGAVGCFRAPLNAPLSSSYSAISVRYIYIYIYISL